MGLESNTISIPFHWSGAVLTVTIVTLAVLIGAGFYLGSLKWPTVMLWLKYLLTIILLATVIVGVGYMPIRLKINDEKITVIRLFGPLKIPQSEIVEIKRIGKSEINNSIRIFGSGGLFGYLGRFKNDRFGSYTMYATELNNLIFIRTSNKKYVFSCSRSKELIEYVNLRLKQGEDAQKTVKQP